MATDPGADETVRVRITGRGIDMERDVSVAVLPQLVSFLLGAPAVAAPGRVLEGLVPAAGGTERVTSIAEYLREKQPRTSADTLLALSGYLELIDHKRPFTREDMRRLMRAARLTEPANFPRDFAVAVTKGYIQAVTGGFQLTNSGLEAVRQPGALATPRSAAARRANRKRPDESA